MEDRQSLIKKILKIYRNELPQPASEWGYDMMCALLYLNKYLFTVGCGLSGMRKHCRTPGNNFSLRFRHRLGKTPEAYLTHHRIEAAKRLLSEPRLKQIPISEIGYAVGYERASTFTTQFTTQTGMPPRAWRNQ